jgi:hypothetical protein
LIGNGFLPTSNPSQEGSNMDYHNLIETAFAELDGTTEKIEAFLALVDAWLKSEGK